MIFMRPNEISGLTPNVSAVHLSARVPCNSRSVVFHRADPTVFLFTAIGKAGRMKEAMATTTWRAMEQPYNLHSCISSSAQGNLPTAIHQVLGKSLCLRSGEASKDKRRVKSRVQPPKSEHPRRGARNGLTKVVISSEGI